MQNSININHNDIIIKYYIYSSHNDIQRIWKQKIEEYFFFLTLCNESQGGAKMGTVPMGQITQAVLVLYTGIVSNN